MATFAVPLGIVRYRPIVLDTETDFGYSLCVDITNTAAAIYSEVKAASDALRAFPRGVTGLTPDAVKSSTEWKAARARYQRAFTALRDINALKVVR